MIVSTIIYIRQNHQTLMLHRNKKKNDYHEGKYNGVGGKLEAGESPEECAIKEVYEETGLTVKALNFRGHITFPVFDGESDWLCFIYECFEFTGEIVESDEGELHWIEDDFITSLNLWEGDAKFIDIIYHTDKFFSGKFIYDNKKLISTTLNTY